MLENFLETEKHNKFIHTSASKKFPKTNASSLLVRDGGLNIILPKDRMQEINWSTEMSPCLGSDDVVTDLQQNVIKQIRKGKIHKGRRKK